MRQTLVTNCWPSSAPTRRLFIQTTTPMTSMTIHSTARTLSPSPSCDRAVPKRYRQSRDRESTRPGDDGTGFRYRALGRRDTSRGGIVISFERMNRVVRLDTNDHVVVVQPGLTLRELGEHLHVDRSSLPRLPGRALRTIGGNVNTNAGECVPCDMVLPVNTC